MPIQIFAALIFVLLLIWGCAALLKIWKSKRPTGLQVKNFQTLDLRHKIIVFDYQGYEYTLVLSPQNVTLLNRVALSPKSLP